MADEVRHSLSEEDLQHSRPKEDEQLPSQQSEKLQDIDQDIYLDFGDTCYCDLSAPEPLSRLSTPPAPESIKIADSEIYLSAKAPAQKKLFSGALHNLLSRKNKRRPK